VATLGWITLTVLQNLVSQIQKGGKKNLSGKMWQQKTNKKQKNININ
jgi:hypothetical protein